MEINYEEMRQVGIYTYVANNYWQMSKEQLASIVKEVCYAASEHCVREYGSKAGENIYKDLIQANAIAELEEQEV